MKLNELKETTEENGRGSISIVDMQKSARKLPMNRDLFEKSDQSDIYFQSIINNSQ